MAQRFLEHLKEDFSNIDEVYTSLLHQYNPDNKNTTEVTFIDSVNYNDLPESNNVLLSKLGKYLGKKRGNVIWQDIDYYNHYLQHGRFTLIFYYKTDKDYKVFNEKIATYKRRYKFIYNLLNPLDRNELKCDNLDQLDKYKNLPVPSKFINLINDAFTYIESYKAPDEIHKIKYLEGIKEPEKIKEILKDKIKNAEIQANEIFKILIEEDLSKIENLKLDYTHYTELLVSYFNNVINGYEKLKNIYKAGNESFYNDIIGRLNLPEDEKNDFIANEKNDFIANERIDFIATLCYSELEDFKTLSVKDREEVFVQLSNLEDYVIETRILQLKSDIIREKLKKMLEEVNNKSILTTSANPAKRKKKLVDFFDNIDNKEAFMQELKNAFPTERGKSIRVIIDKLYEENMLIYGDREFSQFYNELSSFFNRDIGTYQSIHDIKFIDEQAKIPIYKKLNHLIINYKKNLNNL